MSKKAWIIFAAICIVLLGGLVYVSSKDKVDVSSADINKIQSASEQSGNIADHVFGKADSKVMLVEYGDFQCPGCGNAYPNIKAVTDKYKDQMSFIFRNFPLSSLHPNARAAAAAAEAAGLQGKYWEMHNILYENQSQWGTLSSDQRGQSFANYAKSVGVNVDTYNKDFASSKVNQKINYDIALGKKAKVNATPTIYMNGKAVSQDDWSNQKNLDTLVANTLKENGIALPAAQ
ncbi:MAG: Na+/H+ antiporter, NhaA family protein nonfunctional [Candidatus Saccharibacteria bacterium]|nr:Na+/H+ antiporter, NhaA family protein nonfunctional [Candidatus Saccharibacteria bacterium]